MRSKFCNELRTAMHGNITVYLTAVLLALCKVASVEASNAYSIDVKAFENETLLLPCDVQENDNEGNWAGKTIWWKDGHVIADTQNLGVVLPDRYIILRNSTLIISALSSEDAGEYKCEVIRPYLSPVVQIHSIKVLSAPRLTTIPRNGIVVVDLDHEVDIACEASGFPAPVIRWTHQGELLELLDNRPRLRFNATSYNASGLYECIANNDIGPAAKATIKVVVHGPPQVQAERHWVHTGLGMRAKLVAWVNSVPAARGEWYHEGVLVRTGSRIVIYNAEDDSSVLMIRNVRAGDLGTYTFRAQNKMGMASASFKLSGVAAEAEFVIDPKVNNATKTSYTLKWQVFSYTSLIEYNLWFRPYKSRPLPTSDGVFIKEKDNTWTKLTIPVDDNAGPLHIGYYTIHGLNPETVYEALVTSRNRFGWSKPSSILHLATAPASEHHHTVDLLGERDEFRQQTVANETFPPLASKAEMTAVEPAYVYKKTVVYYSTGEVTRHSWTVHLLTLITSFVLFL